MIIKNQLLKKENWNWIYEYKSIFFFDNVLFKNYNKMYIFKIVKLCFFLWNITGKEIFVFWKKK